MGGAGVELRPNEAAPVVECPDSKDGGVPRGAVATPGGPTGGTPGQRPGAMSPDPVQASGGPGTGGGFAPPASCPASVGSLTIGPELDAPPEWLGTRRKLKQGLVKVPEQLPELVEHLNSLTQSGLGRLNLFRRPDLLREEGYIRQRFELPPIPCPHASWAERRLDLVRDGQARAVALDQARREALTRAEVEAAIKARRDAQIQTRQQALATRGGGAVGYLPPAEELQDHCGDQWALTHEPLGPGLKTPDEIQALAAQAGVGISLSPEIDSPWELPHAVEARRSDPQCVEPEKAVRVVCKLRDRDDGYYARDWAFRKIELIMDGWRHVSELVTQAIRDLPRTLEARRHAAREASRLAREARAQRRAEMARRPPLEPEKASKEPTKPPSKPSDGKGGGIPL